MTALQVALLGYGTVGKGVYQTIHQHQARIRKLLGREVKVAAVLVKDLSKHELPDQEVILTDQFSDILGIEHIDVVIDAIVGVEPGFTYLQEAIKKGCHVITANKEMFAYHSSTLQNLAAEHGVTVGFEATVAGGIPIIQTLKKLLNANKVQSLQGILNGTSNFILTKMREEQLSFSEALTLAQQLGYAEADPANDIEGHDAFYKAVILSEVLFGEQPVWEDTVREGIAEITIDQIDYFHSLGLRFKHVASLEKAADAIKCSVKPVLVSSSHPLYQVENVQNAINIEADIVGSISLQGPGAGMFPTASAIIEDLIHIDDKEYIPCFDEELSPVSSATASVWVILGKSAIIDLPDSVSIIRKIGDTAWLVEATEDSISAVKELPCFQLLGSVDQIPKVEKVY
ncbi:homoserine dehydrogenase [Cytobacillus purgationiresistens]|uniref:Homoserine dehydrogenase n=1 Tax=Cytobacillus purgationiresistens TaxID=863449 RepID=A0ABU0AQR8_9BACI|nr:homoserine dehydrogenase [Cytobacillus purgationiresistens]MDQ0273642.1 homoserine dehydrogenase [Cytobacillus purgationiresistens]